MRARRAPTAAPAAAGGGSGAALPHGGAAAAKARPRRQGRASGTSGYRLDREKRQAAEARAAAAEVAAAAADARASAAEAALVAARADLVEERRRSRQTAAEAAAQLRYLEALLDVHDIPAPGRHIFNKKTEKVAPNYSRTTHLLRLHTELEARLASTRALRELDARAAAAASAASAEAAARPQSGAVLR